MIANFQPLNKVNSRDMLLFMKMRFWGMTFSQKSKNLKLLNVMSLASIGSLIYTILSCKISHKNYYTPQRKFRPLFQIFPPDYYRVVRNYVTPRFISAIMNLKIGCIWYIQITQSLVVVLLVTTPLLKLDTFELD